MTPLVGVWVFWPINVFISAVRKACNNCLSCGIVCDAFPGAQEARHWAIVVRPIGPLHSWKHQSGSQNHATVNSQGPGSQNHATVNSPGSQQSGSQNTLTLMFFIAIEVDYRTHSTRTLSLSMRSARFVIEFERWLLGDWRCRLN